MRTTIASRSRGPGTRTARASPSGTGTPTPRATSPTATPATWPTTTTTATRKTSRCCGTSAPAPTGSRSPGPPGPVRRLAVGRHGQGVRRLRRLRRRAAGRPGQALLHHQRVRLLRGRGLPRHRRPGRGGKTFHLGAAPGLRLSDAELKQVRHHAVLGHGLAVQAIRARGPAGTKAGFAENIRVAVPVIDTPRARPGRRDRHPGAQRRLHDRAAGGPLHRRLPGRGERPDPEVHRRRTGHDRLAAALCRHQRLQAGLVCRAVRGAARATGRSRSTPLTPR
jgi:hypothetical protein